MARGVRTVKVRFDGDVAGLRAQAKQGERIIEDFGDNAGTKFTDGVDRSVNRSLPGMMANAAARGLIGFGIALQGGALRNPLIAGALGAAVLAGVVATMPALGTLAAGLLVAAFGAGLAGLGIAFAAQSKRVRDTWSDTLKHIGKTMRQISKPFEDTLVAVAGQFQAFFGSIADDLQDAFKRMAPAVEDFTDNLFESLGPKGLGKTIKPVSDAFIAMMDALGPELPGIMSDLADSIIAVTDTIKENPKTFANLVKWLFGIVNGALRLVAVLSRVANWFEEHPNVTRTLIQALKLLFGPIAFAILSFKLFRATVETVTGAAKKATSRAADGIRAAFITLRNLPGKVADWFRAIGRAIRDKLNDAVAFVRSIPGKIKRAFGNPGQLLRGIGRSIIDGLAGGIRSAAGNAARAAVDAVKNAISAARRALNIGSPSKLAADAIGAPIGQGIAVGMRRTRGLVERTGRQLAGAAVPNATGQGGGLHVENLNVRAFSDRFSLAQIQDELALHGAA